MSDMGHSAEKDAGCTFPECTAWPDCTCDSLAGVSCIARLVAPG